MFGQGPASNPELYQPDKKHLLLHTDSHSCWNAGTPFTPVGGPNFKVGDLLKLQGLDHRSAHQPAARLTGPRFEASQFAKGGAGLATVD